MKGKRFILISLVLLFISCAESRIQTLKFSNDDRGYIQLSSFGYLKDGSLTLSVSGLKTKNDGVNRTIGFTFDKSSSEGRSSYVEHQENVQGCTLDFEHRPGPHEDTMRAIMRLENSSSSYVLAIYTMGLSGLKFKDGTKLSEPSENDVVNSTKGSHNTTANKESNPSTERSQARRSLEPPPKYINRTAISVTAKTSEDGTEISFSLDLSVTIETLQQEGLYELYFHNCRGGNGFKPNTIGVSGSINITETNDGNYLSAGDIALPVLYAVMSSLFFFMAFQWISVLCVSTGKVFMIHYMMAVLVIIKGMSLTFHAIDLYFISKDGTPETWAIIFYVVHLLKGVLLFIILLLIGTGWAFIKYVLSDREKKLFMIVIPLQVFANIAYIVIQDTSESSKSYYTWKNVMILVDILCCGAILIPVVWSVRHLQEASQTDGKAAINLQKLKLFQRFYVMIICYLYFTRLIVYLLEITLAFQLIWIHMLFSELGSLIFFFLTGYQFRPGCDNPYLSVPQDDEEYVESLALTESGATENITRVNKHHQDDDGDDEEDLLLPEWRVTAKSSGGKKFTSNV